MGDVSYNVGAGAGATALAGNSLVRAAASAAALLENALGEETAEVTVVARELSRTQAKNLRKRMKSRATL